MPPTPVPPTTTLTPAAANFVNSPILDFTLENLSVAVGTTIIWENQDAAPHTTTSDVPADKTDIWDSGTLNKRQTSQFTFREAREFAFFCSIYPFMTATITRTYGQPTLPTPAPPTSVQPTAIPPTAVPSSSAQSMIIGSSKDNTLYETSAGDKSNGIGTSMFTGNTNARLARRALIAFDLSVVPDGATINSVTLTLNMSKTSQAPTRRRCIY